VFLDQKNTSTYLRQVMEAHTLEALPVAVAEMEEDHEICYLTSH
jgi:hypothetical protein